MAQPIQTIKKNRAYGRTKKVQSLENLLSEVAQNKDSLLETLHLLQELHDSGILEALGSLVKAKESVAKKLR
ncbi:hypothetical protein GCM10020331_082810 [Ectobacillus funiculus]